MALKRHRFTLLPTCKKLFSFASKGIFDKFVSSYDIMTMDYTTTTKSTRIINLSFFMALGIVWTHSRFGTVEGLPGYFNSLFVFNEIGEKVVAGFFFISGYLFYRNYKLADYGRKLKSRTKTLLLPYIIWNALSALGWYLAMMIDNGSCVADNHAYDGVVSVISGILSCQYSILWYIGVLIVYAIASPLFYVLCQKKWVAMTSIILFGIVGVSFHHPFCSPVVWMATYMAGAYTATYYKDFFYDRQNVLLTVISLIVFPIAFWQNHAHETMLTVNLCQWSAPFFFYGIYDIADRYLHFKPHGVYKYSFFLYAAHYIPLHVCQRLVIRLWGGIAAYWSAYILVPILVVALCLAIALFLDRKYHRIYAVLSGDR